MKLSPLTRQALRGRREVRDLTREGWEQVGEGGGNLWELHRGCRHDHVITDVRIACDGKSLWIKTSPRRKG